MEKKSTSKTIRARKLALQALYQWLMTGASLTEIEAQFYATNNMARIDTEYFNRLLHQIPACLNFIEEQLKPFLDRSINDLNPIELTVLRLGAFELLYCPELPYRIVLDSSISLAKEFGSQDGYRYVNGVLHSLSKQTRKIEINLDNG